jgi:hypothetical protein
MLKFIISKGWEGFSDRLQCLSYCVTTALRYNRVLIVDWTDDIWGTDFYRYFHFDNLEYIQDYKVIPKNFTVYPKFYQHKLMLPSHHWVYDIKDQLKFDINNDNDFSDVWVHSGIGYREYNIPLLTKHLRINTDIVDSVYAEPITDKPVVHLRGTDRQFTEDDWQRLRQLAPTAYVLSDDTKLIDRWKSESPDSIIISTPLPNITHFSTNVDKHEQNIKLLREFFILGTASMAYGLNNDSLYFKMSRMVGSSPYYKSMFCKQ